MSQTAQLNPKQRELFEQLMARRQRDTLRPRPQAESVPLSYSQERIFFMEQLAPRNTAYTVAWAFDVKGEFDADIFSEAFSELRDRHELLRLRCLAEDGRPRLTFDPTGTRAYRFLEASDLPDEELTALATEFAREPFELETGPLSRLTIIRHRPEHHVVVFQSHHMVIDSWSAKIVLQEMSYRYNCKRRGVAVELPELPLTYSDFAYWQRKRVEDEQWRSQLDYWTTQLQGAPPYTELPTDRVRPSLRSYKGRKCHFHFTQSQAEGLKALCAQKGVTLFTVLLALFQAYLSRLSGQTEVVVGTAISDRFPKETECLVGSLANPLALRTRLSAQETLSSLLPQVRSTVAQALAHKDIPFERVVEELSPARNLSHEPIFQLMFILHEDPLEEELNLDGCRVRRRVVEKAGSRFDLMLEVVNAPEELFGWFEYSQDLFEYETVQGMTGQFLHFAEQALAHPEELLEKLSITPPDQRERLASWGIGREIELPASRVEELIGRQLENRPGQRAVGFGTQWLTYRELDQQIEHWLQILTGEGLKAGHLVAVRLPRSLHLLPQLLAIWRCHAAFLPLGKDWPPSRCEAILREASPHWLWDESGIRLRESGCEVDSGRAYAIATSGSTGEPKVVSVGHEAVVNLLASMEREPGLSDSDLLLSGTPYTFDISMLEFFLPLTTGASVLLLPDDQRGGCGLRHTLEQEKVTVLQATPTVWRLLLDAGWTGQPDLRIWCGGEPLTKELAQRMMALQPKEFWNLYGPTETTIWSTVHRVEKPLEGHTVALGRPVDNTVIRVVNEYGSVVPVGVIGEIQIAGAGLAQGYLGRREFLNNDGYYPTGDLGAWDHRGRLVHHGRRDTQVKVRGVRLELEEIESVLGSHPAVVQAVAVARDHRLEVFVLGQTCSAQELQAHVRARLPETHVPSVFRFVESIPTTSNGKVDRLALSEVEGQLAGSASQFQAPQTATEEKLVEFFTTLLEIPQVSRLDDFFALGGHSLLALSLVARIESAFDLRFPLRWVFEFPNIAAMAEQIETRILEEVEAMSEEEARQLVHPGHESGN